MNAMEGGLNCLHALAERGLLGHREAAFLRSLLRNTDAGLSRTLAHLANFGEAEWAQDPFFDQSLTSLRALAINEAERRYADLFSFVEDEQTRILSRRERAAKGALQDSTLTYGEITFASFDLTLRAAGGLRAGTAFLDCGHGAGKACVAAALLTDVAHVVGYEVLEGLHEVAREAARRMDAMFAADEEADRKSGMMPPVHLPAPVLHLRLGSFTDPQQAWKVEGYGAPDMVFANSTCFGEDLMRQIASRCVQELSPGACVITFTRPADHERVPVVSTAKLQQSWGPAAVFIHEIKGPVPTKSPFHSILGVAEVELLKAPSASVPVPVAAKAVRPTRSERPKTAHPSRRHGGQRVLPPPLPVLVRAPPSSHHFSVGSLSPSPPTSHPWHLTSPTFTASTSPSHSMHTQGSYPFPVSAHSDVGVHGDEDGMSEKGEEEEEEEDEESEEDAGVDDTRAVYTADDRRAVYGTADDEDGEGAFAGAVGKGVDSDSEDDDDEDDARTGNAVIAPPQGHMSHEDRDEEDDAVHGGAGDGGSDTGTGHGSAAAIAGDGNHGRQERRVRIGGVQYNYMPSWDGEEEEEDEEEEEEDEGEDVGAPETVHAVTGRSSGATITSTSTPAGSDGEDEHSTHASTSRRMTIIRPSRTSLSAHVLLPGPRQGGARDGDGDSDGASAGATGMPRGAGRYRANMSLSSTEDGDAASQEAGDVAEDVGSDVGAADDNGARPDGIARVARAMEYGAGRGDGGGIGDMDDGDDGAADDNPVAIAAAASRAVADLVRRVKPSAHSVELSRDRAEQHPRSRTGTHVNSGKPVTNPRPCTGDVARELASFVHDLWAEEELGSRQGAAPSPPYTLGSSRRASMGSSPGPSGPSAFRPAAHGHGHSDSSTGGGAGWSPQGSVAIAVSNSPPHDWHVPATSLDADSRRGTVPPARLRVISSASQSSLSLQVLQGNSRSASQASGGTSHEGMSSPQGDMLFAIKMAREQGMSDARLGGMAGMSSPQGDRLLAIKNAREKGKGHCAGEAFPIFTATDEEQIDGAGVVAADVTANSANTSSSLPLDPRALSFLSSAGGSTSVVSPKHVRSKKDVTVDHRTSREAEAVTVARTVHPGRIVVIMGNRDNGAFVKQPSQVQAVVATPPRAPTAVGQASNSRRGLQQQYKPSVNEVVLVATDSPERASTSLSLSNGTPDRARVSRHTEGVVREEGTMRLTTSYISSADVSFSMHEDTGESAEMAYPLADRDRSVEGVIEESTALSTMTDATDEDEGENTTVQAMRMGAVISSVRPTTATIRHLPTGATSMALADALADAEGSADLEAVFGRPTSAGLQAVVRDGKYAFGLAPFAFPVSGEDDKTSVASGSTAQTDQLADDDAHDMDLGPATRLHMARGKSSDSAGVGAGIRRFGKGKSSAVLSAQRLSLELAMGSPSRSGMSAAEESPLDTALLWRKSRPAGADAQRHFPPASAAASPQALTNVRVVPRRSGIAKAGLSRFSPHQGALADVRDSPVGQALIARKLQGQREGRSSTYIPF